jgi:hypothetical protein
LNIKFRGKRVADGDWTYGWLVIENNGTAWISRHFHKGEWEQVDPATVSQFTGEHEQMGRKGKEIYVGDIVEISTLGINYENKLIRGVVDFVDGCYEVEFSQPVYDIGLKCQRHRLYIKCFVVNRAIKVIGNIHEPLTA